MTREKGYLDGGTTGGHLAMTYQKTATQFALTLILLASATTIAMAQVDSAAAEAGASQSASIPTNAEVEQLASKLFNKVMSPYCPGRTIANCPSPGAADLQVTIKDKLQDGESPDEIEEELYATFGDELRAIPRARGFNLLAWILPGLFFGIGLVILTRWLRGLGVEPTPAIAGDASGLNTEDSERLKRELEELEN